MLASLPCTTTVCETHAFVGFVIVGGWLAILVWGGLAWWPFRREPNRWFWRLLGFLQGILILQLVIGVILWISNPVPTWLHPLYGAVFPAIILVIAHVLARGMDLETDRYKVFAVAAFFIFGLTLRALMTGLGVP
jgi:hypothetical protein